MPKAKKFSILITTKNRLQELIFTLKKIDNIIYLPNVECIVCDDGSTDGTYEYMKIHYPIIKLIKHQKSKGLIASRNELLNLTKAKYAISLDDDAHFISKDNLAKIENHFKNHKNCGVIAFSIIWTKKNNINLNIDDNNRNSFEKVKGFVGCGHAWNLESWKSIPNYPEWFEFYGEEDFASLQLFKKKWEVHYVPEIIVQHRVNLKERKINNDYWLRYKRSLRAGWYIYLLFYPTILIPKKIMYSIYMQLKTKLFKGNLKYFSKMLFALFDVICNYKKILKNSNRLTVEEYKQYLALKEPIIFWEPNKY